MAHGKIRVNTLTYDTGSGDVDVAVSTLGARRTDSEIDGRITAATGVSVQAFDADNAVTDAAQTFTAAQRGDITELTGTSFTLDLNASNNFKLSPSGTFTVALSNLAAAAEGQTGSIFIVYSGTESGTFPTTMKFVGGAAGITLTSTAGAIDRIDYIVMNSTTVTCNVTTNYVA